MDARLSPDVTEVIIDKTTLRASTLFKLAAVIERQAFSHRGSAEPIIPSSIYTWLPCIEASIMRKRGHLTARVDIEDLLIAIAGIAIAGIESIESLRVQEESARRKREQSAVPPHPLALQVFAREGDLNLQPTSLRRCESCRQVFAVPFVKLDDVDGQSFWFCCSEHKTAYAEAAAEELALGAKYVREEKA